MKKIWLILVVVGIAAMSCKSNKKNRCNTCPKWEDKVEVAK